MTTRNTLHKDSVWHILTETKVALSADEVLEKITSKINRTTVYRILDRFEEEGKVHKIIGLDQKAYYSPCKSGQCGHHHHHDTHAHFQCKKCFRLQCIELETALPSIKSLEIETQQVLLIGLCKNCK